MKIWLLLLLAACSGGPAPQIRLTGRILSVHEASDTISESCKSLADQPEQPKSFEEIKISTGKRHGAFYTPLPAWVNPVLDWVHGVGG